ncbi:MAG: hypothetical protein R6V19_17140 [Armatimonadota bacterium]
MMFNLTRVTLPMLLILALQAMVAYAQEDPETARGVAALAATIEATGPMWLEAVEEEPLAPDLEGFAVELVDRDDIVSAEVQGDVVGATTADGIVMRFTAPPPGVRGSGGIRAGTAAHLIAGAVTGRQHSYGDLVPTGKALVIHGHHSGYKDMRSEFRAVLEEAGYVVDGRRGLPEDFAAMSEAAIIVVDAHGSVEQVNGAERYMIQSDYLDDASPLQGSALGGWYLSLKENELGIYHRVEFDKNSVPKRSYWGVDIYDSWLESNIDSMVPNALVLLLTCHSADSARPWSLFREKGAGAMLGFTGVLDSSFGWKWGLSLLKYVLGTSTDRPSETAPYLRPWALHDAFDRIISKPGFAHGADWSTHTNASYHKYKTAKPVLQKAVAGPDNFSAAPHIDQAWIYRLPGSVDYTLALWGAFGPPDDCTLTIDGRPLQLQSTAVGLATPWNAVLPAGVYGDLVLTDGWGRQSNPVTISEFTAHVSVDYDDDYYAGAIELEYTEPVAAAQLYRAPTDELVFAGAPAWNQDRIRRWLEKHDEPLAQTFSSYDEMSPGWPLVMGIGDVRIHWDFDSVKTHDQTTYVTRDHGERVHRATDMTAFFGPHGRVQVFMPVATEPDNAIRDGLTSVQMQIELRNVRINGQTSPPVNIRCDVDEAQTTYDWRTGVLNALQLQEEHYTLRMDAVHLGPKPYDPDDRAASPVPLYPRYSDAHRCPDFVHLHASLWGR